MFKFLINNMREYIFIILTATIFSLTFFSKSFSSEKIFTIDNVQVEGAFDKSFSRDKYINKAFLNSFDMLLSKILLSGDSKKFNDIKLKEIKLLIDSFQISKESYQQDIYKGVFKIFYNDKKVKNLLVKKNISFSEPKNISAVLFPVLFIDDKLLSLNENFFYNEWAKVEIQNELINFLLPIEDLEDFSKIRKMKNKMEEYDFKDLIYKYDTKNYVFMMMIYEGKKLNIYLKTNFNNNVLTKNIKYKLDYFNDKEKLSLILKELKIKITDIWKSENIINLATTLSIRVGFEYNQPKDLNKLKNVFYKIGIIDKYILEEFNINNSSFKIFYYGKPKKLSNELLKFGYKLKNNQGKWEIYINE